MDEAYVHMFNNPENPPSSCQKWEETRPQHDLNTSLQTNFSNDPNESKAGDTSSSLGLTKSPSRGPSPQRKEYKILFIGSCGAGKSSTINSLAQKHLAKTDITLTTSSVTDKITTHTYSEDSIQYHLIDTPGLTEKTLADLQNFNNIHNDLAMVAFVIPTGRLATEEIQALRVFAKDWKDYHRKTILVLVKKNEAVDLKSLRSEQHFEAVWKEVKERHVEIDNKHFSETSMDETRSKFFDHLKKLSTRSSFWPQISCDCIIT